MEEYNNYFKTCGQCRTNTCEHVRPHQPSLEESVFNDASFLKDELDRNMIDCNHNQKKALYRILKYAKDQCKINSKTPLVSAEYDFRAKGFQNNTIEKKPLY